MWPGRSGWAPAVAVLAVGLLVTGLVWRQNRWGVEGEVRRRHGMTSPVVPAWVRSAVHCLEGLEARSFRAAGRIATDYQRFQPLAVAAWPLEVENRSPLVVVAADELGALPCAARVLCQGEGVAVAACPP
jgi:hypothetical protein